MKERLPALAESLRASGTLIQPKVERRAFMAALSLQGIDPRTIAVVTQSHATTVHRWVNRVEEGGLFTDLPRCGRPRRFDEAARLTTIAVYCQQAAPTARSQPVVVA